MIEPLRKRSLKGELYTRDPAIEAKLLQLVMLSRDDLVTRCEIRSPSDPGYVPTECVLHFVRASRRDNSNRHFERLYKILAERVRRALPKTDSGPVRPVSLTKANIRDKAADRFTELLATDRNEYNEKLDFFEVKFDQALARLRLSAQEQAWNHENRTVSTERDDDSGDIRSEVEQAAGSFDPFDAANNLAEDYRSRLSAAIDHLPEKQIRIIEMLRLQIPIDSQDPYAITISKTLGRSEKTIRTYRDKAFAALRLALSDRGEK